MKVPVRSGVLLRVPFRQESGADTVANRLRFMLADNMGSPRTFEFRRRELMALRAAGDPLAAGVSRVDAVSDEQVLQTFLSLT